jgi:hypothetical protein
VAVAVPVAVKVTVTAEVAALSKVAVTTTLPPPSPTLLPDASVDKVNDVGGGAGRAVTVAVTESTDKPLP